MRHFRFTTAEASRQRKHDIDKKYCGLKKKIPKNASLGVFLDELRHLLPKKIKLTHFLCLPNDQLFQDSAKNSSRSHVVSTYFPIAGHRQKMSWHVFWGNLLVPFDLFLYGLSSDSHQNW